MFVCKRFLPVKPPEKKLIYGFNLVFLEIASPPWEFTDTDEIELAPSLKWLHVEQFFFESSYFSFWHEYVDVNCGPSDIWIDDCHPFCAMSF
ncbi:hypothetical protein VCHA51O444_10009 [Vibrio chagasii]|nr:hypothetical protein VCHA51O444_10009 [Vibrio chagasii]